MEDSDYFEIVKKISVKVVSVSKTIFEDGCSFSHNPNYPAYKKAGIEYPG